MKTFSQLSCFAALLGLQPCFSSAESLQTDPTTGSAVAVTVPENAALAHTTQIFPAQHSSNDIARQTREVLGRIEKALKLADSSLTEAVKLNVYLCQTNVIADVRPVLTEKFSGERKPAISFVCGDLAEPSAFVAMDAIAVSAIKSPDVLRAVANSKDEIASVAVLPAGPKVYVSGMADTNNLQVATHKTLEKLLAAIGHLNLERKDIVQLKVFLQPMSDVAVVRKEIVEFFNGKAPPTVFVEWISPAPNPPVEIELIAAARGDFSKETNSVTFLTPPGTTSTKVFSRVARVNRGKLIYTSGLYGIKSDGVGQVREIFSALGEITKETGSDFEHLVKATYYVTDNDASNALNDLRPEYFNPQRPPAASKAKVKGVGVAGKTVTLDMIAVTK